MSRDLAIASIPAAVAVFFCLPQSAMPAPAERPIAVAVVEAAGDSRPSPLVEPALLEGLPKHDGIRVVEREVIDRVLDELQLSAVGLTDPATAVKFGKMVSADAFVIVEQGRSAGHGDVRLRIVATRTGIRLLDRTLDAQDAAALQKIVDVVSRALGDFDSPQLSRRSVGVLGIHSEEPGHALEPMAVRVEAAIEQDLQSPPETIVLERRELARLMRERDLTGVELSLRGSTVLLEGGLRRSGEGQELVMTLVLRPLVSGNISAAVIEVRGDNEEALSAEAVKRLRENFNTLAGESPPKQSALEAAYFARRYQWLSHNGRSRAALPLAEAALALNPTLATYDLVYHAYQRAASARPGTISDAERFRLDIRAQELDWIVLRMLLAEGKTIRKAIYYPVWRFFDAAGRDTLLKWSGPTPVTEETREWMRRVNQVFLEKYEWVLSEQERLDVETRHLLNSYLDHARWMTPSAEEYTKLVISLQQQFDAEIAAGRIRRTSNNDFCGTLFQSLEYVTQPFDHWNKRQRTRAEALRDVRPLLDWLAAHEDPALRYMNFYLSSRQEGAAGADAARKAIDVLFDELLPRDDPFKNSSDEERFSHFARSTWLHAPAYLAAIKEHIQRAEDARDASPLIRSPRVLIAILHFQEELLQRTLALLRAGDYDPALAPQAEVVLNYPALRKQWQQEREQLERGRPDLWSHYAIKPIPIANRTGEHERLVYMHVDDAVDVQSDGEPLLLFWRNYDGKTTNHTVTRLGVDGGRMREVIRFSGHGGEPVHVVSTADAIFVAWLKYGITMIRDGKADWFGESEGIPSLDVQKLAWLDGQLYLALPGALASFDPAKKTFTLLASSKSIRPRSALDGGFPYETCAMLADPQRHCLWLSMAPYRAGIWKYIPATNAFEQVYVAGLGQPGPPELFWNGRVLLFRSVQVERGGQVTLWQFDPDTGTVTHLPGYGLLSFPSHPPFDAKDTAVALGQHVIDGGRLLTPEAHAPWPTKGYACTIVRRCGWGFIAAYYRDSAAELWYAKRITRDPPLSRVPDRAGENDATKPSSR